MTERQTSGESKTESLEAERNLTDTTKERG